ASEGPLTQARRASEGPLTQARRASEGPLTQARRASEGLRTFTFSFRGALVAVGVLAVAAGALSPVFAQGKNEWEVLIAYDKDEKPKVFPRVALRPNVEQAVLLYLRHPGPLAKKNVAVKLVRVAPGKKIQIIGETTIEKISANQVEPLKLKPIPPPKDEKPKEADPKDQGPPFKLQLWFDAGTKNEFKLDLPLIVQQPHEYVRARALYKKERLSVFVETDAASANPECKVQLVLTPDIMPGVIPPKVGTLVDDLKKGHLAPELFADNVQFQQGLPPKSGRVHLTVDGYERAYVFKGALDQGNLPPLPRDNRVRLYAPRFFVTKPEAPPDPKAEPKVPKLMVRLEVDGDLNPETKVEVSFDRAGDGTFVVQHVFSGQREQTLAVAIGAEGALACKTVVKDWQFPIENTAGVFGKRSLRVRLLNAQNAPLTLAEERELPLFSRNPAENPFAPLSLGPLTQGKLTSIDAEIIINDTGPENVRFVDLPEKAVPGNKFKLKATAKRRDEKQTRILSVQFFVGNQKEPLQAVFDKASQTWQADATMPAEPKDKVPVSVRFNTEANLSATATGAVLAAQASDGAKVTGKLSFNSILQPDVEVKLLKGKESLNATKTVAGVFVFENVAPGNYVLSASKFGGYRGTRNLVVPKGQAVVSGQDFELKRNP
ncbi:MAG: carboxypeptidase-like regulatory domain-containing protein, partial [Gemmataceae bacterium]|nr:carboxypeptidase-like regulatory domain-containing protein [Gemmataceae bacterium]